MTITTPEFQGTHLWDRLCWAKEKLEPVRTEYCVVWEDPDDLDAPAKVTHPDPNWMACALQGGILPPVEAYWELAKDEAKPDFKKHTRLVICRKEQLPSTRVWRNAWKINEELTIQKEEVA
jgi:hypothetical protein